MTARPTKAVLLAALYFLLVTIVMTWPLAQHAADGMTDQWDAKLSAWILHWDYRQTLEDPLNLFQAPILHPARYALAFSENLYGEAVFGFPAFALGASRVLVYNLVFLLGMFTSALSAWALARYVTGDPIASIAAGWVYGFLPWRFAQSAHIHMQWGAFLCLIALFLLRYLDGGRRRDAVLCGICFAWNGIASIHYGFFAGFLAAVILLVERLQKGPECNRRLRGASLAMALGAAACIPFAVPYAKASSLYGMRRRIGELETFSARWSDFLSAGLKNRLYGALTVRWQRAEGVFFPGLLPLFLAAVPVLRLRRAEAKPAFAAGTRSAPARGWVRLLDVVAVTAALLCVAALLRPGLRLAGVKLRDPGRILVILTAIVFLRLGLAFPRRSRYRDLGDYVRRLALDRRVVLFLAIGATGVLVALGAHTPYYRFLFQSAGTVFGAIRAPARGIVLFQLALGVLAAWGLSYWMRGASTKRRIGSAAAATLVFALEYRAFPIPVTRYDAVPAPVYRWLAEAPDGGAVVEWPLGFPHDAEYTFRQADHRKPLVNGYSSYFPPAYGELWGMAGLRPIPDSIWEKMAGLGAGFLVYHSHETQGRTILESARAIRRAFQGGSIRLAGVFEHQDGKDFVFHIGRGREAHAPDPQAAGLFEAAVQRLEDGMARFQPPFGFIHLPEEGQSVVPGFWAFGWALDDSGIAAVRVGTELGETGLAEIGRRWPGLADVYPEYRDPGNGGYGFAVPALPPGPRTLRVTLVGRDGGQTVLERRINVLPPASPTPRGPGS